MRQFHNALLLTSLIILISPDLTRTSKHLHDESSNFQAQKLPQEPTYFVLSSQTLEPGKDYRLVVSLFRENRRNYGSFYSLPSFPHTVKAQIWREGSAIASETTDCHEGMTKTMSIKVPDHMFLHPNKDGNERNSYKLVVEGHRHGRVDGLLFRAERPLKLKRPEIWIYIETERPIYRPGQIVSAKVIPFQTSDHKPWTSGSIDAKLRNPSGEIVARWDDKRLTLVSRTKNDDDSIILLKYELAQVTAVGEWRFEVSARGEQNLSKASVKVFRVEEYFPEEIEVRVWLPPTVIPGDKFVNGWISSNKIVGGASARGTLKLYAIIGENSTDPNPVRIRLKFKFQGKSVLLSAENGYSELKSFSGFGEWRFSQDEIQHLRSKKKSIFMRNLPMEMTVEAHLLPEPDFSNEVSYDDYASSENFKRRRSIIGYSTTRLLSSNLDMKILTPPNTLRYRPDLPYIAWVRVSRSDGSDLTLKDLEQGVMTVESSLVYDNGTRVTLLPLSLRRQHKFFTPGSHPLWKLSYSLRHVLPLNYEQMSPDELYGSSLLYTELNVIYNTREMEVKKTVKLIPDKEGEDGSQRKSMTTQGLRVSASPIVPRIGDNIIFHVHSNFFLEGFHFAIISSSKSIISTRYIAMGQSSLKTFHEIATKYMAPESTLVVWMVTSDGHLVSAATKFTVEASASASSIHIRAQPVITSGFGGYTEVSILGGSNFKEKTFISFQALDIYLRARTPKVSFPSPDLIHGAQLSGDLESHGLIALTDAIHGFEDNVTDNVKRKFDVEFNGIVMEENSEQENIKIPTYPRASPVTSELSLTGFWRTIILNPGTNVTLKIPFQGNGGKLILTPLAFSRESGYFLHPDLTISIGNPFQVTLEVPDRCRYGEILSGKLTFINKYNHEVVKAIRIYKSMEFTFVDLEGNTQTDSIKTFQVRIPGNSFRNVQLPFRPSKSGKMTLNIQIDNSKELLSKSIEVVEEGINRHFHKTLSVDLINHRYFFDKFQPEAAGKYSLMISGGIHGPLLPELPLNSSTINNDLPAISCDDIVFSIIITLLHKEERGKYISSFQNADIRNALQKYLQALLSYRTLENAFSFSRGKSGTPSLWITTMALRALHKLSVDSLNVVVDPRILYSTLEWLTKTQKNDGSFREKYLYPDVKDHYLPIEMQEIALTAQILLVLAEMKDDTSSAQTIFTMDRAIHFLTSKLGEQDVYGSTLVVALVSRALQVARAPGAEAAFEILAKRRKEKENFFYWSSGGLKDRFSSGGRNCDESLAVRSTAIALLVYTERGEFMSEPIITWLNSKRKFFSGWSTMADTAYVIEAFNLWTSRNVHVRDSLIYAQKKGEAKNVAIEIRAQSSSNVAEQPAIVVVEEGMSRSVLPFRQGVRETVQIEGSGKGFALVQLHGIFTTTKVSDPGSDSSKNSSEALLDLKVDVKTYGDATRIKFRSCHRWFCKTDKSVSGPAVLQIQVPTGYRILRKEIIEALRQLKTEEITEDKGQLTVFFSKLSRSTYDCLDFSMYRQFRVAHLSPFLYVKLSDYYSPDRFNETLLFLPELSDLKICTICGSSECPDCGGKEATTFSVNLSTNTKNSLLLLLLFTIPVIFTY